MSDLAPTAETNTPAYSVSELAFALKRTLEDAYGFVRLRGELSKVTHHSNGHVYLTLKDERAALDGVVWKGQVRALSVRPEQGLEVIVTGKITTYPAGSRYQIVIETMEAAGVGALLAQLERLKEKLRGEGLFDQARKRPLPSMPAVVGVITSPTGAVIRDILHRIRDRWPCRVIVWPVVVQGDAAAAQVRAAIEGFNRLVPGGPVPRPDILIVARGGGSVEDLWPFNDEALARCVAAGEIPLISAVGHETDTTLIDFVSDRRAPTPTAAAEIATPVLAELRGLVADLGARMHRCGGRVVEDRRQRLAAAGRSLARTPDLVELAAQRFNVAAGRWQASLARNTAAHERDLALVKGRLLPSLLLRQQAQKRERLDTTAGRLQSALLRNVAAHDRDFRQRAARLKPALLDRPASQQRERLDALAQRLAPSAQRNLDRAAERMRALAQLLGSVDPDRPLERGFARVHRQDGSLVRAGASLTSGEAVTLKFADVERGAVIDGEAPAGLPKPAPAKVRPRPAKPPGQGDLF